MTDRKVMQQALEALEFDGFTPEDETHRYYTKKAITALKAALEQQQAEPICPECKAAVLYECVACSSNNYPPKQQAEPPQRQWVGLTDEEILSTDPWEILRADPWMGTSDSNINPYQILLKVRTLEAKLKERNA